MNVVRTMRQRWTGKRKRQKKRRSLIVVSSAKASERMMPVSGTSTLRGTLLCSSLVRDATTRLSRSDEILSQYFRPLAPKYLGSSPLSRLLKRGIFFFRWLIPESQNRWILTLGSVDSWLGLISYPSRCWKQSSDQWFFVLRSHSVHQVGACGLLIDHPDDDDGDDDNDDAGKRNSRYLKYLALYIRMSVLSRWKREIERELGEDRKIERERENFLQERNRSESFRRERTSEGCQASAFVGGKAEVA